MVESNKLIKISYGIDLNFLKSYDEKNLIIIVLKLLFVGHLSYQKRRSFNI